MPDVRELARLEALARFRRPAQGMLDEILFPWNIRDLLQSTDSEYERINLRAKGQPEWDIDFQSWKNFYQANKDPGWLSSSQETAQEVRRRQARLAEWQKQLAAKGVQTGPNVTVAGPAPLVDKPAAGWSQGFERLAKWGAVAGVLYLGGRALRLGDKLT